MEAAAELLAAIAAAVAQGQADRGQGEQGEAGAAALVLPVGPCMRSCRQHGVNPVPLGHSWLEEELRMMSSAARGKKTGSLVIQPV